MKYTVTCQNETATFDHAGPDGEVDDNGAVDRATAWVEELAQGENLTPGDDGSVQVVVTAERQKNPLVSRFNHAPQWPAPPTKPDLPKPEPPPTT